MYFDDEPLAGENLPILPGHVSAGRFERVLRSGHFAVTTELAAPDSADPQDVYDRIRVFDGFIDAVVASDDAGANCHMSSIGVCSLLSRIGYSSILQLTCRDKNRIALQGDVLGAAAMGVANVHCLSGNAVKGGDHPDAKQVFDFDCMSLLESIRDLRDKNQFQSGRSITAPPRVFIGATVNPFAMSLDQCTGQLAEKTKAGAQYIMTDHCFDVARFKEFMSRSRDQGLLEDVYILPGVGPMVSAQAADWIRNHVPGMHIPDTIIKRLEGASDQQKEGLNIAIELIQELREVAGVNGVHVVAFRQEETVAEIIDRSGVLEGRVPWYPGRDEVHS